MDQIEVTIIKEGTTIYKIELPYSSKEMIKILNYLKKIKDDTDTIQL